MIDTLKMTSGQMDTISNLMGEFDLDLKGALVLYNSNIRAEQQKLSKIQNLDPRKMNKPEIIEATWKLPELDQRAYKLLSDQGGFMTGSNVISNIEDPKDEDWCVLTSPSAFAQYSLGQSDHGYWEADGFSTVYCHYHGRLINIICFSDTSLFDAWFVATQVMNDIKNTPIPSLNTFDNKWHNSNISDIFATKWKRVILFRALKDIAYEPKCKREMDVPDAVKYQKCCKCSREAIYFTCKEAKDLYLETTVCERCAGIIY